jgi:hypothetical protein
MNPSGEALSIRPGGVWGWETTAGDCVVAGDLGFRA